jgi:hypothetical protein
MVRQRSPAKVTLSPRATKTNGIIGNAESKLKGELKELDKVVHQASAGHEAGLIQLVLAACGIYGSLYVITSLRILKDPNTDALKSRQLNVGSSTRKDHNDSLRTKKHPIHLPNLSQYCPIHLRSHLGLDIPHTLHPQSSSKAACISQSQNLLSPSSRCDYLVACFSVRLCLPQAYRLHNLHSGQVLQVGPSHAPAR